MPGLSSRLLRKGKSMSISNPRISLPMQWKGLFVFTVLINQFHCNLCHHNESYRYGLSRSITERRYIFQHQKSLARTIYSLTSIRDQGTNPCVDYPRIAACTENIQKQYLLLRGKDNDCLGVPGIIATHLLFFGWWVRHLPLQKCALPRNDPGITCTHG